MKITTWPDSPITPLGGWSLTADHSASSYGLPVLVSPEGQAFGPADLLTPVQVADIWGYSVLTVRRYADQYGFAKIGHARFLSAAKAVQGPPPKAKPGRKPKEDEP